MSVLPLTEEDLHKLYCYALRKTASRDDAEELAQEMALAALTSLSRGSSYTNKDAWLYGVARNKTADWVMKRKAYESRCAGDSGAIRGNESERVEDELVRAEEIDEIRRTLAHLAKDYRKSSSLIMSTIKR